MIKYCLDRYKTQKKCDKAADVCLTALEFVPDSFVPSKMLEIVDGVAFSNDYIDLDDVNFDIVTFFSDDMVHDIMDLNYINLDDNNFDDDPETIIHVRFMA